MEYEIIIIIIMTWQKNLKSIVNTNLYELPYIYYKLELTFKYYSMNLIKIKNVHTYIFLTNKKKEHTIYKRF